MEQDIEDGVDVKSVSLSFALEPYDDPIAKPSFSTMEQGIVITTSSCNEGPQVGILRNGIPWVLTVVADTIDRWFVGIMTLGNGMTIIGWSIFWGNLLLQKLSLVYDKNLETCNSFASLLKAQYGIIICHVGNIDNQIKSLVAM
ncbi:subtilisin-like protease SBT1.9 [Prunus yedoensis var. nudiflora]|uniref:Subtilisin-like protease SBT1.9 n=1 Tax=Prunus yedoensis var. nudiflora TaxID=2094558 RepID=A0A314XHJ5_PRUYE|nr:subtilisin-like protease SBT1.9 [Prunus yedoensis var. nudiflora]